MTHSNDFTASILAACSPEPVAASRGQTKIKATHRRRSRNPKAAPQALTTRQRKALMSAVETGDVETVRRLLSTGLDPASKFKRRPAIEAAMESGQEALVQPFVEAFRQKSGSACELSAITCAVFIDDRFSAAFASTLVTHVGLNSEEGRHVWDMLLSHGLSDFDQQFGQHKERVDEVLAGKVALAVAKGWMPSEAWREGWLPHHEYLNQGLIEAALACVVGGANPDESMRRFGIESSDIFGHTWSLFQARLQARERAQRAAAVPPLSSSTHCTRQRA